MSTDAVDFRGAIGAFFAAGWGTTTEVAWPGRDYTPPTDQTSWVRMSIIESDTFQHEIGTPCPQFREVGLIIFQVFTKADIGDGPARALADQIATIFRRQSISYTDGRALIEAPAIRVIGPDAGNSTGGEGGAWFQVNVSIPYKRDTLQA